MCIAKKIRTYFQTGALPEVGTLCQADLKPLVGRVGQVPVASGVMDAADRDLLEVLMREVKEGYFPFP